MKPSSDHELEIVRLVDQRAIEHKLQSSAAAEIAAAVTFAMSESETQFLVRYIIWRRDHAVKSKQPTTDFSVRLTQLIRYSYDRPDAHRTHPLPADCRT
jgi:hypothetical protein